MQVAEILSDLTYLRACDHNDALALVTAHERLPLSAELEPSPSDENQSDHDALPKEKEGNEDFRRAKELVDLHYEIKARHGHGTVDAELSRAREDVDRVLRELRS